MPVRPGFADPVLASQQTFRAVLGAMAHPGRVVSVQGPDAPSPLGPAAAAVCLTLLDFDTPLWLDPAAATADVVSYVRFHCGAPLVDTPGAARFALVVDPAGLASFDAFDPGTDERPDLSATLVVQVDHLGGEGGARLRGPGIEDQTSLTVSGAPWLWDAVRVNAARFPRGVDVILCAGARLAALPRTIRVEDDPCTLR
jgi:alpha-D-ribose 1-methylphosphonate 5-triphosphate synthase subunit PhnH